MGKFKAAFKTLQKLILGGPLRPTKDGGHLELNYIGQGTEQNSQETID